MVSQTASVLGPSRDLRVSPHINVARKMLEQLGCRPGRGMRDHWRIPTRVVARSHRGWTAGTGECPTARTASSTWRTSSGSRAGRAELAVEVTGPPIVDQISVDVDTPVVHRSCPLCARPALIVGGAQHQGH